MCDDCRSAGIKEKKMKFLRDQEIINHAHFLKAQLKEQNYVIAQRMD